MKKDALIIIAIIVLGLTLYGLTLRGAPGNPIAAEFKNDLDQATKAFELSPERGRFVQVANMAESGVYNLSHTWAEIAYPDVGVSDDGKFDSLFAPGVSYFALPFYLFGAPYGLGQVAAFAVESLVSIVTLVFIYLIGRRVFALPRWAAFFAVLTYGFASTSWSYAITLYQNAFTTMFIVTAFYATWRFSQPETRYRFFYAAYVWLAYALAITVDYPNAVLFLPVMVYFAASTFSFEKVAEGIALSVRWSAIAACSVFMAITAVHFWHNATYYGGWSNIAGTLHNYTPASELRVATSTTAFGVASSTIATTTGAILTKEKKAVAFFHEKAIPNSSYVLLFSDERGLFFFSPLFLLSILGIVYAFRKREMSLLTYVIPFALVLTNLFLYSAWGDPWGGWAFGPRYLIPSLPWLALFIGLFLATISNKRNAFLARLVALLLFVHSAAVSLLGALTTNAVPTKLEAALLPIHDYNYLLNIRVLVDGKSSSFVYNTYLSHILSLPQYYGLLFAFVVLLALLALSMRDTTHE